MAELKKCPFCGSKIKGGVRLTGYMMMNRQYIKCDACGAKMETEYDIDGLSQTHLKAITEDLIKRWNTRPTATEAEIRAKAIDEVFELLRSKRDKKTMRVNLDDLEIRKYKEQLGGGIKVFRGTVLGITYYTWEGFKNAYNEAVLAGKLFDKDGNKITTILN